MRQIKIPIFLKILFFVVNFFLLFNFLVIQNIFSLQNILMFILIFINFFLQFFILKNSKKAVFWMMGFLPLFTVFWLFWVFSDLYFYLYFYSENLFSDLPFSYEIFLLIFWIIIFIIYEILLFLTYKKLKKENISENNFTNKKQEITFSIIFFITFLFLSIFKFWYYNIPEKIEISDEIFKTKLENEKFESDENIYISLKNFSKKYKIEEKNEEFKSLMFDCLFLNKCFWEKQDYIDFLENEKNNKNILKIFYNKNNVETMSVLDKLNTKRILRQNFEKYFFNEDLQNIFKEYLKFWEKKYFKSNYEISDSWILYGIFFKLNKEFFFKTFFLMQNWYENEALEILEKRFEIILKILNWDLSMMDSSIWNDILMNNLENLEKILENFEISRENKNILIKVLEKNNFKAKDIFDNSVKFEFNRNKNQLKNLFDGTYNDFELVNKQTLFILKDSIDLEKQKFKSILDRNNNFEPKINIFKRNIIWQKMTKENFFSFLSIEKKLLKTEKKIQEIIEKLKK